MVIAVVPDSITAATQDRLRRRLWDQVATLVDRNDTDVAIRTWSQYWNARLEPEDLITHVTDGGIQLAGPPIVRGPGRDLMRTRARAIREQQLKELRGAIENAEHDDQADGGGGSS